jgi:hypothetical protein
MGQIDDINLHLPTTEDEALLRGNTRLLLYFLFDPGGIRVVCNKINGAL